MTGSARQLLAFRYMTRFACLGGACEDTCCSTWNVSVDRLHLVALERRMTEGGERARFQSAFVEKPAGEQRPWAHAVIRMREGDGRCPLLGNDGLCDVHRRWGDEALPDVCSFFPRYLTEVEGRAELAGSLSCPEVVRQALLRDDGLDLLRFEDEEAALLAGRTPVLQRPGPERQPFVDELRGLAWMILDGGGTLRQRLHHMALVAEEAEALLESDPDAALGAELEPLLDAEARDGLDAELRGVEVPSGQACGLLLAQLARLRSVVRPPLRAEIDAALDAAVQAGLLAVDATAGQGRRFLLAPGFAGAWSAHLAARSAATTALVDAWLERLLRERIFRDVARPDTTFVDAVRAAVLRLCALRLLLLLHPAADDASTLSAWMVRLVCGVARVADHDAEVRAFLDEDARRHLGSLADLAGLLPLL